MASDGAGDGTFGDGSGDRTRDAWGTGIVRASIAEVGAEESTGKVGSHEEGDSRM